MRFFRLLIPIVAVLLLGMAEKKMKVTVRFFAEANARDGASFSTTYKLTNPPRDAYLQKIPAIDERQIQSIYPFRAPDGTWGCAFKLDVDGRIKLEVVSTDHRGKALVGFIGTKKGTHPAVEMIIDRTVSDGVISIPRGLTDLEMSVLRSQFKVLGGDTAGPAPKASRSWSPFRKKDAPAQG